MVTLAQAKKLHHGQTLYHKKFVNSDGTAQRWRVSGQVKTWKTRPNEISVPVKHGMYDNDHLTHYDLNLVTLKEPKVRKKKATPRKATKKKKR